MAEELSTKACFGLYFSC